MAKKYLIFGIITALLFILSGQFMLLLFSFLLLAIHFQDILQKISNLIPLPLIIKVVLLMMALGVLTESLAIINNAGLSPDEIMQNNRLFASDPATNVIIGFGYYIPLGIIWYFLLRRYRYSTLDVILTTGVFGIFFEGKGAVLASLNPAMWLYAFLVHGSYITMMYLAISKDKGLTDKSQKPSMILKYPVGFIASMLTFIFVIIWESIIIAMANG